MDKLYMILLCLMIVPILICIKYSRKIKSDVASSIVKCLIFAIVTILSNGLSTFSGNETFSYIMEALYRFSFDLMLIYVLQYSQQYTRVFHEVSPFKKGAPHVPDAARGKSFDGQRQAGPCDLRTRAQRTQRQLRKLASPAFLR